MGDPFLFVPQAIFEYLDDLLIATVVDFLL